MGGVRNTSALVAAGFVGLAALAVLAIPTSVTYLAGLPETAPLTPPDQAVAPAHDTPMALLLERDTVELTVRTATRLDRFIQQNRLRRQRPQIRAQLRLPAQVADDQFTIPAGTTFRLRLTPEASDVPGAANGGSR